MDNKPTKGQYIEVLLRSPKTVFTTKDIALLWGEKNEAKARVRLSNYAKIGNWFELGGVFTPKIRIMIDMSWRRGYIPRPISVLKRCWPRRASFFSFMARFLRRRIYRANSRSMIKFIFLKK